MYYNAALVLEGGAMRGCYTAGVLDQFIKDDIQFRCVIGVSAGSLAGANYVSKQYGRTFEINTKYRDDKDYISLGRLFHKESIINLDYLFNDHGTYWHNLDENAYNLAETDFVIVATSLNTGKRVEFHKPKVGRELIDALEASSSMPIISKPKKTSQGYCLDGGIADSIPYDLAKELGFDKVVVIRTRDREYRKKPTNKAVATAIEMEFKKYPAFCKQVINRPENYNNQVKMINRLEQTGDIFCIAPKGPVKVGRLERNTKKLTELYESGLKDAHDVHNQLISYLTK
ncbi:Predicted phospholipase, patatin/cPLA2 family [Ligilactobacillus sp. WC1T17]|uniref:Predicted phospholipase, patatin/cPLA2 family n=1 Tax=Ligilactobacillus ruminis TaxID=1623 RepID=A0ABY1A9G9_9LACO|nr:Predicted phospholipase, patatin/cPLA2 family [Ligilactobacillus ruminis]